MKLLALTFILLLVLPTLQAGYSGILALSWLAGFCQNQAQNRRELCEPSLTALWDNQSHTIHGFWPDQKATQKYGSFNVSIFEKELKLLDDMNNYWPPKVKKSTDHSFLWEHEWDTHGQDYAHIIYQLRPDDFPGGTTERNAALQLAYFKDTIALYKNLKVQKLPGASFSKSAYASQLGVSEKYLYFACFKGSSIRETYACYEITKEGMKLKDCTKSTSTCANGGAVIELYQWYHKSQQRVFNLTKQNAENQLRIDEEVLK